MLFIAKVASVEQVEEFDFNSWPSLRVILRPIEKKCLIGFSLSFFFLISEKASDDSKTIFRSPLN